MKQFETPNGETFVINLNHVVAVGPVNTGGTITIGQVGVMLVTGNLMVVKGSVKDFLPESFSMIE